FDSAGQAHAAWGDMFYLDDVIGDDVWSYFPGVDGLNYWNESYGADSSQYVAFLMDADGDDEFLFAEDLAAYGTGSTAHPSIGEDAMGNIYIAYAGLVETHLSATQNYRHVHVVKSEDGGTTFADPVDVTPDVEFIYYEYAFPVLADIVDDNLHIIAQRDGEPGTSLTDSDPVVENDWVYLGISPDLDVSEATVVTEVEKDAFKVYPNPAAEQVFVLMSDAAVVNVDLYDMTGKLIVSQQEVKKFTQFDVANLAPGLYTLTVTQNGNVASQKLIVQ
ncbi:MAG: T9SS type A sorting domain-containing protein, partial [Flavobacteriales bacterium]|nr:T9SS type A sorting domain-containing protein [Flavobacteriales bacterium]